MGRTQGIHSVNDHPRACGETGRRSGLKIRGSRKGACGFNSHRAHCASATPLTASSPSPSSSSAAASPAIRNISDTARWAAIHRARETERSDALFRDPYARRLAGERGERIAHTLRKTDSREWPWVMRTVVFDEFIERCIADGADMIINLAAGLDARPYRMNLPPSLQWVEIDLPELLEEKRGMLADEKPRCALEHIPLDLADVEARRAIFARLGVRAKRAMIIAEGLLIYLASDQVASLSRDLAAQRTFGHWAVDICSPGLLRILQKRMGNQLHAAEAPFKFGPPEGPLFFQPHGWSPADVRSIMHTAAKHRRLPLFLRLLAMFPPSNGAQGGRPWGGLCLLQRT